MTVRDALAQDVEQPALVRQLVQKDDVEDDPADRQQAVGRAVPGAGHAIGAGMPKGTIAMASARARPASAAMCAGQRSRRACRAARRRAARPAASRERGCRAES